MRVGPPSGVQDLHQIRNLGFGDQGAAPRDIIPLSSDVAKSRITDNVTRIPSLLGPGLIPGRLLSRIHLLALTWPGESTQDVSHPCGLKKRTALWYPVGATRGPGHQEYCVNMPKTCGFLSFLDR